jgi:HSP20 family molecular chaperone IbpA
VTIDFSVILDSNDITYLYIRSLLQPTLHCFPFNIFEEGRNIIRPLQTIINHEGGMDPKEIDISMSDGLLTIKGEKKQEKEENLHFIERNYGSFTRSVRLPKEVQTDKITASYKNGILKVTLPKSEEAKKKEIKVKVE